LAVALGSPAAAEETVLRVATVAPDGTAWAREARAFGRDVVNATSGRVRIRWYFGGIAGDDLQMGDRLQRGQLDGVASGGILCQRLAPSMKVLSVPGLYRDRAEVTWATGQLRSTLDGEFRQAGYSVWGAFNLGPVVAFSRTPLRTLADMRKTKLYNWDLNEIERAVLRASGLQIVPLPLTDARRAYDEGAIDGFVTIPGAALAFQWSVQARYLSDLQLGNLVGCIFVADRALDHLSPEDKEQIRAAWAKLLARLNAVDEQMDTELLTRVFARQGMQPQAVDERTRAEYLEAAKAAQGGLPESLLPHGLLERMQKLLADHRASETH
jgi:TRAP-type C4-dicarboxylate transport system substrate-binding protein